MSHIEYNNIIALNYSGAKQISKSAAHYKAWLDAINEGDQKDTPALKIGRLVHLASLQPRVFNETVHIEPDVDRRTKDGKAVYEAFKASLKEGDETVDSETYAMIDAIAQSVEQAFASLKVQADHWKVEQTYTKDYNGVTIKGRPDLVTRILGSEATYIFDVKTCQSAEPSAFAKDVANYKYHLQDAFYSELVGTENVFFIAVEKEPPYAYRIYSLDAAAKSEGKALMNDAVATYKQCLTYGKWPSYTKDVCELSLPKWAHILTQ
jgi:exodeoxyribonuclease VIII